MSDEFVSESGQVLYLPRPSTDRDLALACRVLAESGYSVLWLSWTHSRGPCKARGPFPYDVTVMRDADAETYSDWEWEDDPPEWEDGPEWA